MSEPVVTGFEIIEKLGEGGMASVWKARQVSLDRIVAVKVLAPHFASDPEDIEMFQKEAQQAAKLKHQGIVQVYDANAENGIYYFVMEFVAGYTVGSWLHRKRVLPQKDALLVAECVADALQYAWEHSRIIHCDIKPDNVMIDDDGTVKVTDLGLARTISAMTEEEESEDVMGTPAYISPEQAMGRADIDFRADIYSLGAMLYHLSTGKLMFEEYNEEDVMELQCTHQVVDPLDLNPELTKPFCWLLEKMLAKDPKERPSSWQEVAKNIERVKKGMMPIGALQDGQISSIQRSVNRTHKDFKRVKVEEKKSSPVGGIVAGVIVAIAIVVGIVVAVSNSGKGGQVTPAQQSQGTATVRPVVKQESEAKEMYDFAKKWHQDNPEKFSGAIDRFTTVKRETRGTKYSLMAGDEVKKIKLQWKNARDRIMSQLKRDTEYHMKNDELLYAADMYENYKGPMAKDTKVERLRKAEEIRALQKKNEKDALAEKKRLAKKYAGILASVVDDLTKSGVAGALAKVRSSIYDKDLKEHQEDLKSLKDCLEKAAAMDERILDTFRDSVGKVITIDLAMGRKQVLIDGVKDGKVLAKQRLGSGKALMVIEIGLDELSVKERLSRMGSDTDPEVALVKGLMALKSGSGTYARAYFEKTHPLISGLLVEKVDGNQQKKTSDEASKALEQGLKSLGVEVTGEFDEWGWGAAIEEAKLSSENVKKAGQFVRSFKAKYGNTDIGKRAEPVLAALAAKKAAAGTPSDRNDPTASNPRAAAPNAPRRRLTNAREALVKDGAPLNENDLIEGLLSDNSDLVPDEIEVLTDSDGYIFRVNIYSRGIKDISWIAKCKALRELYCGSIEPGGHPRDRIAPLNDISCLSGLKLEKIYLAGTSVKNIDPLSNMKLEYLDLNSTRVSDISAIKNMDLIYLNVANTMVKDLSPIAHMNLQDLDVSGARVYNFKPIMRKQLRRLSVADTQFKDLGLLKGMPLQALSLARTKVYDFRLLESFGNLRVLDLSETQIKDISLLKGMQLRHLVLNEVRANDYEVLRGMPLNHLALRKSNIDSIDVLTNSGVRFLDIGDTQVNDITPVSTMNNLEFLIANNIRARSLEPLAGMNLRSLHVMGFRDRDIEVLQKMANLRDIVVTRPQDRRMLTACLRIPGLKQINWFPKQHWANVGR
ncbi:hypothetical protein BVX97_04790 [bacterium E08(2017)]|nr:hypothetical protein BVX97_04790 [bacterium E08(2017)]